MCQTSQQDLILDQLQELVGEQQSILEEQLNEILEQRAQLSQQMAMSQETNRVCAMQQAQISAQQTLIQQQQGESLRQEANASELAQQLAVSEESLRLHMGYKAQLDALRVTTGVSTQRGGEAANPAVYRHEADVYTGSSSQNMDSKSSICQVGSDDLYVTCINHSFCMVKQTTQYWQQISLSTLAW